MLHDKSHKLTYDSSNNHPIENSDDDTVDTVPNKADVPSYDSTVPTQQHRVDSALFRQTDTPE